MSARLNSENIVEEHKKNLFGIFSVLANIFLITYAVLQYSRSQHALSIVYALSAIAVVLLWFMSRKKGKIDTATRLLSGLGLIVLLPWQITGGIDGTGVYWFVTYIVFLFIFVDIIGAIFWLGLFTAFSVGLTLATNYGLTEGYYTTTEMIHVYFSIGLTTGLMATFVSLKDKLENTFKKQSSIFSEAESIAHIGSWEWNLIKNTVKWSDEMRRIFEVKPEETLTHESYMKLVHEDDVKGLERKFEIALNSGEPYSSEHRVKLTAGKTIWIKAKVKVILDNHRKPVKIYGTCQDITSHKVVETELRKQNDALTKLERIMVNRELKMISLKERLEELDKGSKT